jgi:hypothetical protein
LAASYAIQATDEAGRAQHQSHGKGNKNYAHGDVLF